MIIKKCEVSVLIATLLSCLCSVHLIGGFKLYKLWYYHFSPSFLFFLRIIKIYLLLGLRTYPSVKLQTSLGSLNLEVWFLAWFRLLKGSFLQNFVSGDWFVFVRSLVNSFVLIEMRRKLVLSWIAATFSTEGRILSQFFLL